MQFKRVLPISDNLIVDKKQSYQNRTPSSVQKKHVKAFEASGLKQVKFCEQQAIPYKTFSNWLKRHRSDRVAAPTSVDQATTSRTKAQQNDVIKSGATTKITCSLLNGLKISISLITLDLPMIMEALSQCKLN